MRLTCYRSKFRRELVMKQRQIKRKSMSQTKAGPIKTTFMELIQELTKLTQDDSLVLAAIRNICGTYNVVATRTLTPVNLVPSTHPAQHRLKRRRTSSACTCSGGNRSFTEARQSCNVRKH